MAATAATVFGARPGGPCALPTFLTLGVVDLGAIDIPVFSAAP